MDNKLFELLEDMGKTIDVLNVKLVKVENQLKAEQEPELEEQVYNKFQNVDLQKLEILIAKINNKECCTCEWYDGELCTHNICSEKDEYNINSIMDILK